MTRLTLAFLVLLAVSWPTCSPVIGYFIQHGLSGSLDLHTGLTLMGIGKLNENISPEKYLHTVLTVGPWVIACIFALIAIFVGRHERHNKRA
jgi:hypothetical protein